MTVKDLEALQHDLHELRNCSLAIEHRIARSQALALLTIAIICVKESSEYRSEVRQQQLEQE